MLEVCQRTVNSSFCSGTSWKPMVSTHKMDLHWASFWRRKAMDERTWFCKVPNRHADSGNQTHSPSHGFCYADLVLYRKPMVWQTPCGHTHAHIHALFVPMTHMFPILAAFCHGFCHGSYPHSSPHFVSSMSILGHTTGSHCCASAWLVDSFSGPALAPHMGRLPKPPFMAMDNHRRQ